MKTLDVHPIQSKASQTNGKPGGKSKYTKLSFISELMVWKKKNNIARKKWSVGLFACLQGERSAHVLHATAATKRDRVGQDQLGQAHVGAGRTDKGQKDI